MSNADTKRNGIQAVIKYEKQQGRTDVQMVQKTGFDLITKGNGEERHIQVKGTDKALFTHRWLEPRQYDALQNDSHFYLMTRISTFILSQTLMNLLRGEFGFTTKSVQWLGIHARSKNTISHFRNKILNDVPNKIPVFEHLTTTEFL